MSYYISLPLFVDNLIFYNKLKNYLRNNPQNKRFEFEIESYYGSFPYNSWNGNINSNYGKLLLNNDYGKLSSLTASLLQFDFSNICLEGNDFNDVHSNVILKECENGSNQIELCDFALMEYIKEKYPQYTFIFGKNADLINPLTSEIINLINEQSVFDYIVLPTYFNSESELLNQIKNKSKIILTVGARCKCNKEKIQECLRTENVHQIYFDGYSRFNDCGIQNQYKDYNEIFWNIETFRQKGFTHFRIDSPAPIDRKKFNLYLIYSLIKEENVFEFISSLGEGVL